MGDVLNSVEINVKAQLCTIGTKFLLHLVVKLQNGTNSENEDGKILLKLLKPLCTLDIPTNLHTKIVNRRAAPEKENSSHRKKNTYQKILCHAHNFTFLQPYFFAP